MSEIQYREFTSSIRDANDHERSFTHAISDESVDAHGSIIKVEGWDLDRFRRNPIVLFAHDSIGFPIAKSTRIWAEGDRLMSRTKFAGLDQNHPYAETAYKLVRDGFLRAWSVGFRSIKSVPRTDLTASEKSTFTDPVVHVEQELMEYSLVPVPSNPNVLLGTSSRSPGFNGWYERSLQVYRQKTGHFSPERLQEFLSAAIELSLFKRERRELRRSEDQVLDCVERIIRSGVF